MNKKKNFIPLTLTSILLLLVALGVGYYFWQNKFSNCRSPIEVSNWKEALSHTVPDKSRLSLSNLFTSRTGALYVGVLDPSAKSQAVWHSEGDQFYQVLAGNATLYSGKLDANKKVTWYSPLQVKEGDAFFIPFGIILQIEAGPDHPLVFSLYAPEGHFKEDRTFVEDYTPGDCK